MGVARGCPLLDEKMRRKLGVKRVPYRCKACTLSLEDKKKYCPWFRGLTKAYATIPKPQ